MEERQEIVWASALSCLFYFVCDGGKIIRSRLGGLDIRVNIHSSNFLLKKNCLLLCSFCKKKIAPDFLEFGLLDCMKMLILSPGTSVSFLSVRFCRNRVCPS
jgi:hypothetical protein